MTVRPAGPNDADFVASLVPRFVEHGVAGGHTRDEVVEGTERVLRAELGSTRTGSTFFSIAVDDEDTPLGFIYASTEYDFFTTEAYAHVSEIATVRSGDGVGAILMDAAEQWARAQGYRLVTLNVIEANTRAREFYDRRGYVVGHVHLARLIGNER